MRRAVLAAAVGALLWALAIHLSGGIVIETPWRALTSRNPVRPFAAGAAALALYLLVWRRHWREDLAPAVRIWRRPGAVAAAACVSALVVGVGWGTRIAAGPDQSGYVSQAAMFARGELTLQAPGWSRDAPWDDAAYSASPVGWHPTHQTHLLAPTYSPGLPLILAAAQRAAGPDSVFYVVPALGVVLVWASYLLGKALIGPWVGAVAAVLVASSPTFLFMQQQVMSDVPVAAFLTLSIAAALDGRHPVLAGLAAGAGVLTRPNLAPIAAVPFLLLLLAGRAPRARRLAAFAAPVALACLLIGLLNWRYHGSPLESGYGPLGNLYSLANVRPNLVQYGRWLLDLHTPLALLGAFGVMLTTADRRRLALATLAAPLLLLALYVPFLVFHPVDWGYTRFLLPGYPAWFAGLGAAGAGAAARSPRRGATVALFACVVVAMAAHGWVYTVRSGALAQRAGDARFARTVAYAKGLPERSVLISNAHSGTLRFYTGRDALRFEAIRPEDLDTAVAHLRTLGYALFLIGDEFEIEQFRARFAGTRTAAALPSAPRASLGGVAVYDLE